MNKKIKTRNKKLFRPMARQNIKFVGDLENQLHKLVSSIKYDEEISLPVNGDIDEYIYCIKKSAYYNCIEDLKILVSKDKTEIKISISV